MYRAAKIHIAVIIVSFLFITAITVDVNGQNEQQARAEDLNRQGIRKVQLKEYDAAISLFQKAIAAFPELSSAHLNLGSALTLSERPEEAIQHIKRGLQLNPTSNVGFNQLGVALEKIGKVNEAIDAFNAAIRIKPDYAFAYLNMGATYLWADKDKAAATALEKSIKLDPTSNEARLLLGIIYARQSRYKEASSMVSLITQQDPNNEPANLLLCQIFLMNDDRQAALNLYQNFKAVNEPLADAMFKTIFAGKVITVPKEGILKR